MTTPSTTMPSAAQPNVMPPNYRRFLTDDNLSARFRFFGNQVFSQRPSERQPNREQWAAQRTLDGLRSKSAAEKATRAARAEAVSPRVCGLAQELDALLESVDFVASYMSGGPERAYLREAYERGEEYHDSLEEALENSSATALLSLILGQISGTFAPVPSVLTAMAPFHPQETGVALDYLAVRFGDIITKATRLGALLLNDPSHMPHEETTDDDA